MIWSKRLFGTVVEGSEHEIRKKTNTNNHLYKNKSAYRRVCLFLFPRRELTRKSRRTKCEGPFAPTLSDLAYESSGGTHKSIGHNLFRAAASQSAKDT